MAYEPITVASGLFIYSSGGKPRGSGGRFPEFDAHDDFGRFVARRILDVRRLGDFSRIDIGSASRLGGAAIKVWG